MGILDRLRFGGQSDSGVDEEFQKAATPARFEVVKIKRDPDGQIAEKETVMKDEIPISKEQAEYQLGGFEGGYEYRQVVINARGRVMDSDTVEDVVGPQALWAEKQGASEFEKELASVRAMAGQEKTKWDKLNENPNAFIALEALEDGDYKTAANVIGGDSGSEDPEDLDKRIDTMQKLSEADLGPEAMKSMAWMEGMDLFGKIQDPDYVGTILNKAMGGGAQSSDESASEEESQETAEEPEPTSTERFEQMVSDSGPTATRTETPDQGGLAGEPAPSEQGFPDPEPESESESSTSEIEEMADEFEAEDDATDAPPTPPEQTEAADPQPEQEPPAKPEPMHADPTPTHGDETDADQPGESSGGDRDEGAEEAVEERVPAEADGGEPADEPDEPAELNGEVGESA